jgi:hypothetical protein
MVRELLELSDPVRKSDVEDPADVNVGYVSRVSSSIEVLQLQVVNQQIRREVFDSAVYYDDLFDVLQVHEDFARKLLDLVALEIQKRKFLQVPEGIFGQVLNSVVPHIQILKILKVLEVCAFDEFDLLIAHKNPLQVLERLTDSTKDVVERSKLKMNGRHTEMSFGVFVHSIDLQPVLRRVGDCEVEPL